MTLFHFLSPNSKLPDPVILTPESQKHPVNLTNRMHTSSFVLMCQIVVKTQNMYVFT